MQIWFISDTHCYHDHLSVPEGVDMVVHCGDESNSRNPHTNAREAMYFFKWYENLPIRHKVYVPGNHSTAVWQDLIRPEEYPGITFLIHQQTSIEGLEVFGSPYTPVFGDWAYMRKRNHMKEVWNTIPHGIDILITHGPPNGILDLATDICGINPVQVGCKSLFNRVMEIKPKIHAFGHIHDEGRHMNYGIYQRSKTKFINCACMDLRGKLVHNGFIVNG